jgi:PHP family Zn ribbon phosphoesterase
MFRVQQLAKEGSDFRPYNSHTDSKDVLWIDDSQKKHPSFVKLVPLNEIIAESLGFTVGSEKVKIKFDELCKEFGSEINILLKTAIQDLAKVSGEKIAEGVAKVRKGDIVIEPGYDGEYGKVQIWKKAENTKEVNQEDQLGLNL